MNEFQVDAEWLNAGARPVVDVMVDEERTKDGTEVLGQKRDKQTGQLKWKVEFPFKGPGDRRASLWSVTVLSPIEPDLVDKRPVFGDVKGRIWHMSDRNQSGLSYSAASFSSADAKPSTKRSAKTGPPVPNGADPVPAGKS